MIQEYPKSFKEIKEQYARDNSLYYKLNQGTAILQTEDELNQYLYSYGNMHIAKLNQVYIALTKSKPLKPNDKINIIDYGCGQGIASIILLNLLEKYTFTLTNLSKIILIDPSEMGLNRAEQLLKNSAPISKINQELDDILETDIETHNLTFHLFSNILDMGDSCFNIQNLASKIIKSQNNKAYFICVSPYDDAKLSKFMECFKNENSFQDIASFSGYFKDENWKMVYRIFKTGD